MKVRRYACLPSDSELLITMRWLSGGFPGSISLILKRILIDTVMEMDKSVKGEFVASAGFNIPEFPYFISKKYLQWLS